MLACQAVVLERGRESCDTRPASAEAPAWQPSLFAAIQAKSGGKGIRTPGLLIANETLYQLSYTPVYLAKLTSTIMHASNVAAKRFGAVWKRLIVNSPSAISPKRKRINHTLTAHKES